MKCFLLSLLLSLLLVTVVSGVAQEFPFPQHTRYAEHIKPNRYSQVELDTHVKSFYNTWRGRYLKNTCATDQYYVNFENESAINVSEGLGYGMMITALMAGHDINAQRYFDGLYRFFRAHPAASNPNLMAWRQVQGCISDSDGAATDGDIDIAYALLLAHAQWGSNGTIMYLHEARKVIEAIMLHETNKETWTPTLGDWVTQGGAYYYSTRTSDFITDHFRAFALASNNNSWMKMLDACYSIVATLQANDSPDTGLLPDFVEHINTTSIPASANFLESEKDGYYNYNACRDPWRLMSDYLLSGDQRPLQATKKINTWLHKKCQGDASKVLAGYKLDGTALSTWKDAAFLAPFVVGAMSDPNQQEWLNDLYDSLLAQGMGSGYYGNTIKMLSLIVVSGNYWTPKTELLQQKITDINSANNHRWKLVVHKDRISWDQEDIYAGAYQVEILSLSGKVVIQYSGVERSVNISKLKAGHYLMRIRKAKSEDAWQVFRVWR